MGRVGMGFLGMAVDAVKDRSGLVSFLATEIPALTGCANGFWRSDGEVDIKQEQGLPRMEQSLQG
jgi:hypothetical protein